MRPISVSIASIAMALAVTSSSHAAGYAIVASGPISAIITESSTFNGTVSGALASPFDVSRLSGGSFRATFVFHDAPTEPGDITLYLLDEPSGMSFELLDSSGVVVHTNADITDPTINVYNDLGMPYFPVTTDAVDFMSYTTAVTGTTVPVPQYGGSVRFWTSTLHFSGAIGGGTHFLPDGGFPTDLATYASFPNKTFESLVYLGSGDFIEKVQPYEYVRSRLFYQVTSLNVVPEPTIAAAIFGVVLLSARRR